MVGVIGWRPSFLGRAPFLFGRDLGLAALPLQVGEEVIVGTLAEQLRDPFAAAEIKWRAGSVAKNGGRATLLAYIDARAVMDRLDDVVGPGRWQDEYRPGADGGIICRLGLLVGAGDEARWVWKEDAAENTNIEGVKGGISDAFKRAAVKWGIGRYLYHLEAGWHDVRDGWANGRGIDISSRGSHVGWVPTPALPSWALPKERSETKAEGVARRAKHDPEWERGGRVRFMAQLSDMGLTYDQVCRWLEKNGKPRPSSQPAEKRDLLVSYLNDGPGSPEQVLEDLGEAE